MTWGVKGLTVAFGKTIALDAVDFQVAQGQVAAVVGGDGAGKTTLLRVLAGIPMTATGQIDIPPQNQLGYVPAAGGVFNDLTLAENLEFIADVYRIEGSADRAATLLERTNLTAFADRLAGNLSGGMRRKLAVIGAMLHQPDLLILDEPTTGIDPVSRSDLWRLIGAIATGGAAVVISSAYLDEAERAASILVLHNGSEVVSGTPEEVLLSMPGSVVDTADPGNPSLSWRRGAAWREWHPDGHPDESPTELEDVVIVAALQEEGVAK